MNLASSERDVTDRTKSQTCECKEYMFELENIIFRFVDTPGINDIGGLVQDSKNIEKIFQYIERQEEITGLILTLNGAQKRHTINVKNLLATLRDRIPDRIYSNILIVLTNCHSYYANFEPSSLNLPETCEIFPMQNSIFSSDHRKWSSNVKDELSDDFNNSMETIDQIISKIVQLKSVSSESFRIMDNERNAIKRTLHDLRLRISDLQSMEHKLSLLEKNIDIHQKNAKKVSDCTELIRESIVVERRRARTSYHNTMCGTCHVICHEHCNVNEVKTMGSPSFYRCEAIGFDGSCKKCPNKCSFKKHYHDNSIIEVHEKPMIEVLSQRSNLEHAGLRNAEEQSLAIQQAKTLLEKDLASQCSMIRKSLLKLKETCRNINFANEVFEFINDLKHDIRQLTSKTLIKEAESIITFLQKICEDARDPRAQVTNKSLPSSHAFENNSTPLIVNQPHRQSPIQQQRTVSSVNLTPGKVDNKHLDDANKCFEDGKIQKKDVPVSKDDEKNKVRRKEAESNDHRSEKETHADKLPISVLTLEKLLVMPLDKDVRKELRLRCTGKSTGCLSLSQLCIFGHEFSKYKELNKKDLIEHRHELEEEIASITDNDDCNIHQVSPDKFLGLVAINILIDEKKNKQTSSDFDVEK